MTDDEQAAAARAIIDANRYMVLGTADEDGRPWVSPVYFATMDYREFFWVSKPEAQHSRNLVTRPDVAIVIFDSTVPINTGRAVYMSAVAREVPLDESAEGLAVFSERSLAHGGLAWTAADIQPPAQLRLYRASVQDHWTLDEGDRRTPVSL